MRFRLFKILIQKTRSSKTSGSHSWSWLKFSLRERLSKSQLIMINQTLWEMINWLIMMNSKRKQKKWLKAKIFMSFKISKMKSNRICQVIEVLPLNYNIGKEYWRESEYRWQNLLLRTFILAMLKLTDKR